MNVLATSLPGVTEFSALISDGNTLFTAAAALGIAIVGFGILRRIANRAR